MADSPYARRRARMAAINVEDIPASTSSALMEALNPGNWVGGALKGLSYPSAVVRKVLGEAIGAEAGDEFGGLGSVASERDILDRLGLTTAGEEETLGKRISEFGIGTALDPLMYVGLGPLTKAGKAAQAVSKAKAATKALAGVGKLEEARNVARFVKDALKAAEEAGAKEEARFLGKGWAEQGRLGQRAALSFAGMPIRSPALVSAMAAVGRPIQAAAKPVWKRYFAPSGRIGEEAFDRSVDLAQQTARAEKLGDEWLSEYGGRLYQQRWQKAQAANKAFDIKPYLEQVESSAQRARKVIEGATPASMAFGKAPGRFLRSLRSLETAANLPGKRPFNEAVEFVIEKGNPARMEAEFKRVNDKWGALLTKYRRELERASVAGATATELGRINAKITRASTRLNADLARVGAERAFAADVAKLAPDAVRQEAERVRFLMSRELEASKLAGARAPELYDYRLDYLERYYTPQFKDWARQQNPGTLAYRLGRTWNPEKAFMKRRVPELQGYTRWQIEDLFKGMGYKGDVLYHDIGDSVLHRMTAGGKSRAAANFLRGVAVAHRVPYDPDSGMMSMAEFLAKANVNRVGRVEMGKTVFGNAERISKALRGTAFENAGIPNEIAAEALKVHQVFGTDEAVKPLMDFVDGLHGLLRFGVTQPFPGFHIRNLVGGNAPMMFLAGMRDPSEAFKGIQLAWKMQRGGLTKEEIDLVGLGMRYASVGQSMTAETAEMLGGRGLVSRMARRLPIFGPESRYGRMMGNLGTVLEDSSKLGLFKWALDKGMDPQAAGDLVKKYLFDYRDLSRFEKNWLRKVAFFYTYTRKAVPLILSEYAKRPGLASRYGAWAGIEARENAQTKSLSPWSREQGYFFKGAGASGKPSFVSFDFPFNQPIQWSSEGQGPLRSLGKLGSMMAPIPRAAVEAMTRTNLRTGRPYESGTPILRSLLPANRVWSGVERLLTDADMRGIRSMLTGYVPVEIDPAKAKLDRALERVELQLNERARLGKARRTIEYLPKEHDELTRQLQSLRTRLIQERSKLSKGRS